MMTLSEFIEGKEFPRKMIFNRNKKQLQIIIDRKIQEKKQYRKECIEGEDWLGMEVQEGKISILSWVLNVLNSPKKWEHGGSNGWYEKDGSGIEEWIWNDDEIFRRVK